RWTPVLPRSVRSTAPSRRPPASHRPNIGVSAELRPEHYFIVISRQFRNQQDAFRIRRGHFGIRPAEGGDIRLLEAHPKPEPVMTRKKLFAILIALAATSALAFSAARARDVPKVATGFAANVVCTETFVSGLDPARVFSETMA